MSLTLLVIPAFLCVGAVQGSLFSQKGVGAPYTIGTFGGDLPHAVKVIRVTNTVAVPVPVPVPFPKHVPYPVSVPKPLPYAVPHPIPIEVTKPVVIRQQLPLEIPKPYAVPQPYSLRPFHSQNVGLSIPAVHLTAPAYHANQKNDYEAYLTYGQEQNYPTDHQNTQSDLTYGQEQSYGTKQDYSQADLTYGKEQSYSTNQEDNQSKFDYGTSGQEQDYPSTYNVPSPGLYMMYDASLYSNGNSGVSLGHNFESTNSLDDHSPSGH